MHLGRRRNVLLREGRGEISEDGNSNGSLDKRHSPPLEMCMQFSLIFISLVILFFGVAVTLIGFWAFQSQNEFISITDKPPELIRLPLSTLVIGIFVAFLGMIGLVGSICFRTITGQTLLGTFSFVMVLVIISEVGAGAAAMKLKSDFEDLYIQSALRSQMMYGRDNDANQSSTTTQEWDKFQITHGCCGAEGYVNDTPPYYQVFGNDSVPTSCCRNIEDEDCEKYAKNALTFREHIYETGCPAAVIGTIEDNSLIMAIFTVVAGFSQLLAVLIAVCLLYANSRLKQSREKTHDYKLLLKASSQLETS